MIREGDFVKDVTTGEIEIIIDIQYVHNRYQVRGKSGWKYGIENIVDLSHDQVLAEVRRLKEIELLHKGLSEHLTKIEQENEILIITSPLMCTIQLEKENQGLRERNQQLYQNYNKRIEKYVYLERENQRLKEDIKFWIENSYKWSRKVLKGETNDSRVDGK
jgi:hypothetical protein